MCKGAKSLFFLKDVFAISEVEQKEEDNGKGLHF
jgi:hypothetical protein